MIVIATLDAPPTPHSYVTYVPTDFRRSHFHTHNYLPSPTIHCFVCVIRNAGTLSGDATSSPPLTPAKEVSDPGVYSRGGAGFNAEPMER